MNYADMMIEVSDARIERTPDKQRLGHFLVRVISSPAGEMRPEEVVPITYDDRQLQGMLQQLEARALDQQGLMVLGRFLADMLLPPKGTTVVGVRELFSESRIAIGQDGGLRLRLRLPPLLAALPWEYLYIEPAGGPGMDGFLALDPRLAVVRHEALAIPQATLATSGPLKVVVALASAEGLPVLDLARERADLEQAFAQHAGVKPIFLPDATLDELQAALIGASIFHFAGHGVFNRQMSDQPGVYSGTGALALYDAPVDAAQLGINLHGNGVRLAMLGGCETGRRDGVNVWSGIAPALIKAQIPAVVAHQLPITDVCAIAFSKHVYQALVGGLPIERAVAAGRIAAYNADTSGRDWGVPVLYMHAADGQLFSVADDETSRQASEEATAVINLRVNALHNSQITGVSSRIAAGALESTIAVTTATNSHISGGVITMTGGAATLLTTVERAEESTISLGNVDLSG